MSSILVVCTGNICRSPVGEAVLQSQFSEEVAVSSAGTHAVVGAPAEPEVQEFLRREIGSEANHTARQLTKELAESSDLILTMTEEHRSWIARTAPRAVRRVFTTIEFAHITGEMPPHTTYAGLPELVSTAARLRARVRSIEAPLDIDDPYRGSPEQYQTSFDAVLNASRTISESINSRITSQGAGDSNV
jgi:protein-tyrosine phosphatase